MAKYLGLPGECSLVEINAFNQKKSDFFTTYPIISLVSPCTLSNDFPVWSDSLLSAWRKDWVLSYPLSAQRRLWSGWADAQADLSLHRAHSHFVISRLILLFIHHVLAQRNRHLRSGLLQNKVTIFTKACKKSHVLTRFHNKRFRVTVIVCQNVVHRQLLEHLWLRRKFSLKLHRVEVEFSNDAEGLTLEYMDSKISWLTWRMQFGRN